MSRNVNQLRRVFWDSLFHLIPWDRLGIGIELPGAAEYGNSPTLLWVISFLIKAHCCNPQKLRGLLFFSCSFLFFVYLCFYFFFLYNNKLLLWACLCRGWDAQFWGDSYLEIWSGRRTSHKNSPNLQADPQLCLTCDLPVSFAEYV